MKTIELKVFSFDELSDDAKERAIEKYYDINIDSNNWSEPIIEGVTEELERLGYYDIKVFFSGFHSQGDGACFTASVDINKWIEAHGLTSGLSALKGQSGNFSFSITHKSRHYYSTSTDVEQGFYGDSSKEAEEQAEIMLREIKKEREVIGDKLYASLEILNDELTSDKAIAETLSANEYEFLENGELNRFN